VAPRATDVTRMIRRRVCTAVWMTGYFMRPCQWVGVPSNRIPRERPYCAVSVVWLL